MGRGGNGIGTMSGIPGRPESRDKGQETAGERIA